MVGLFSDNIESAYRDEVLQLARWCEVNRLSVNTIKTKELVIDFRKVKRIEHSELHINGAEADRMANFKFLGVKITNNLSWSLNTSYLVK